MSIFGDVVRALQNCRAKGLVGCPSGNVLSEIIKECEQCLVLLREIENEEELQRLLRTKLSLDEKTSWKLSCTNESFTPVDPYISSCTRTLKMEIRDTMTNEVCVSYRCDTMSRWCSRPDYVRQLFVKPELESRWDSVASLFKDVLLHGYGTLDDIERMTAALTMQKPGVCEQGSGIVRSRKQKATKHGSGQGKQQNGQGGQQTGRGGQGEQQTGRGRENKRRRVQKS